MTDMNPTRRERPLRLTAVAAAFVVSGLLATHASAQYRVDNSQARDANNRVGSGGFNGGANAGAFQQRVGGSAGNYIVTGNVTGGRAFRGSIGYTDPTAFRGSLGSAAFDTFYRDSVGFGTARGANAGNNNYATIQPFFGPGRTVAPPSGFVADPNRGGGFVPAPRTLVQSNDARIDYGGATNAEINRGIINSSRVIGGAGMDPGGGTVLGSGIAPFDYSAPPQTAYQLSEYTSLARQRPGLLLSPLADPLSSAAGINRLRNDAINNDRAAANPLNPNAGPTTPGTLDNRLDTGLRNTAVTDPLNREANTADASNANDDNANPTASNSQYAELRRRLDAADRTRRLPGSEAVDQANERNRRVLDQRNRQNGNNDNANNNDQQPNNTNARPGTTNDQTGTNTPGNTRRDEAATGSNPLNTRVNTGINPTRDNPTPNGAPAVDQALTRGGVGRVTGGSTTQPAVPHDTLNLPRPQNPNETATPATQPANNGDQPMRIQSLATGVRDPQIADALRRAEALMKDGKFATAIDTYERAGNAAHNRDPIIFMGVGIAELGGSYYRRAETHLRQAFEADHALLYAKFDLRTLLGDQRLNFLVNDLGETARTNPRDPGPLMLLAFIYYNGGMEDRAARALAMAQQRAGNNDETVRLLQQTWKLPDQPSGGAGEDLTK